MATTSKFPVAINTMGSEKRMALALQIASVDDLAQEISLILKAKPPTDLREGWSLLKQGINLLHARPKHVKNAACQEVVHRFEGSQHSTLNAQLSLDDLPILKCWPNDGGRFVTLPNVHTRDPGNRRAQSRDVPDAGLRQSDHRDALAGAQGRGAAREALLRTQRTHAGGGHDRGRSGLHFRRDRSAARWAG